MALGLRGADRQRAIRGRTFFRAAYYFPSLTSSAAITAIAIYMLNADGLLNASQRGHGHDPTRRGSPTPTRRSSRSWA